MNKQIRLSSVLLIAVAMALLFLSLASAQTSPEQEELANWQAQHNPAGTVDVLASGGSGLLSITGGTFTPVDIDSKWSVSGGILTNPNAAGSGYYIAPITLPQGATVTQLLAYYRDGDAVHNIAAGLYAKTTGSDEVLTMAVASSDGAPGYSYAFDDSISYATIDNQAYSYYSLAYLPPADAAFVGLISIRVDYTFPGYLPCVVN